MPRPERPPTGKSTSRDGVTVNPPCKNTKKKITRSAVSEENIRGGTMESRVFTGLMGKFVCETSFGAVFSKRRYTVLKEFPFAYAIGSCS
jgi:hypothetical protein